MEKEIELKESFDREEGREEEEGERLVGFVQPSTGLVQTPTTSLSLFPSSRVCSFDLVGLLFLSLFLSVSPRFWEWVEGEKGRRTLSGYPTSSRSMTRDQEGLRLSVRVS